MAPFARTGGWRDVIGTVRVPLAMRGYELSLIMPAYRCGFNGPSALDETGIQLAVTLGVSVEEATVLEARLGQHIFVYLVRADSYFDRDFLYGTPYGDYPDNAERFTFFSIEAFELCGNRPVESAVCDAFTAQAAFAFLRT